MLRSIFKMFRAAEEAGEESVAAPLSLLPDVDIDQNDPLLAYLQGVHAPVDLRRIEMASDALTRLRASGVQLIVPLRAQGELIGVLNLGPRLSDQEYSVDDRRLLENLAGQVAPAVRVAQLVREQRAEAQERQRIAQELAVARLIQQTLLPRELPDLPGWTLAAHYRPAREVGGDFYDFIQVEPGKLLVIVGDVTDKGVPAALVMASTRSILRSAAQQIKGPGAILEHANELLCPDMPPKMFVTCLAAVLDLETGQFTFANAGHNLPFVRSPHAIQELDARGMPLGLLPGMQYEEQTGWIEPGDVVLLHSDGLAEAHNERGEMYGFPRLAEKMMVVDAETMIDSLLDDLAGFKGDGDQEDDITLVTLQRAPLDSANGAADGRMLAAFSLPSEEGNERRAIAEVLSAITPLAIVGERLERLKTAVTETAMNAIEHGNGSNPAIPFEVEVCMSDGALVVRITDQGGAPPEVPEETPDIEAKLAGLQRPRGWGLFLIRNMVDDLRTRTEGERHSVELVFNLMGGSDGR